jgi:hypothetical protein
MIAPLRPTARSTQPTPTHLAPAPRAGEPALSAPQSRSGRPTRRATRLVAWALVGSALALGASLLLGKWWQLRRD